MTVHGQFFAAGPAEIVIRHGDGAAFPHVIDCTAGHGKGCLFLSQAAAEFLHAELGAHLALLEADERTDAALSLVPPETPEADR